MNNGTNGVFVVSSASITVTFKFQLSTRSGLNYPLFYISKGSLIFTSVTIPSENSNQASVCGSIVIFFNYYEHYYEWMDVHSYFYRIHQGMGHV